MTTLALSPSALPGFRTVAPRSVQGARAASGPKLAATLVTSLGALLMATVLYTGVAAVGATDYTVVADTLVAHEDGLVTVVDGRY